MGLHHLECRCSPGTSYIQVNLHPLYLGAVGTAAAGTEGSGFNSCHPFRVLIKASKLKFVEVIVNVTKLTNNFTIVKTDSVGKEVRWHAERICDSCDSPALLETLGKII